MRSALSACFRKNLVSFTIVRPGSPRPHESGTGKFVLERRYQHPDAAEIITPERPDGNCSPPLWGPFRSLLNVSFWRHFSEFAGRADDVRSLGQSRLDPSTPTLPSLTQLRHLLRRRLDPSSAPRRHCRPSRRDLARNQLLGFLFHAAAGPRIVLSARSVRMKLRSTSQNSSVAENIGLCPLPSKR